MCFCVREKSLPIPPPLPLVPNRSWPLPDPPSPALPLLPLPLSLPLPYPYPSLTVPQPFPHLTRTHSCLSPSLLTFPAPTTPWALPEAEASLPSVRKATAVTRRVWPHKSALACHWHGRCGRGGGGASFSLPSSASPLAEVRALWVAEQRGRRSDVSRASPPAAI